MQTSLSTENLRLLLDSYETPPLRPGDPDWMASIHQVTAAALLLDAAEQLLHEAVSDMRGRHDRTAVVQLVDGRFITQPRRAGDQTTHLFPWKTVGGALGISAQAAQQRFTPKK